MMKKAHISKSEKGQTWIIMAIATMVLIVMLGFAIDSAILFSNYTKLKRAVDAAAVAAANDYKVKNGPDTATIRNKMQDAALEILNMHELDLSKIHLTVYVCDVNQTGNRDPALQTEVPDFYNMCPDMSQTHPPAPRKLVYVQASEEAPTYFLHIIGINSIPLTTYSVSEAAPIDLVLVFDTSESMGDETPGYNVNNFDPGPTQDPNNRGCNFDNSCLPLLTAKNAAKQLIDTLYDKYDRVAIVTFAQVAVTRLPLTTDMATVKNAIDQIPLHDDAPGGLLGPSGHPGGLVVPSWYSGGHGGFVNPVDPEDRDGNGSDVDPQCYVTKVDQNGNPDPNGAYWLDWDVTNNIPCDKDDQLDAFDWNQDGMLDATDVATSQAWVSDFSNPRHMFCKGFDLAPESCPHSNLVPLPMSVVSTCTGCGIRIATADLVNFGRSNAVWVMVVLSDGVANLTDTPQTFPELNGTGIPAGYPDGYCGGSTINNILWTKWCVKQDLQRYCINPTPIAAPTPVAPGGNCPTGSSFLNSFPVSPPFSPGDYARDMVDRAALLHSNNPNEPMGSDLAIYSIGLGNAVIPCPSCNYDNSGAALLRYMAAVGDDGDRTTDPCSIYQSDPKHNCGQYYFAQNANQLGPIFDSIASRIYTKITY